MLLPFSATLQKQYRDTLETSSAPTEIETSQPVMPVAVVAQVNTSTSASYVRLTDGTDTAIIDSDGRQLVGIPTPSTSQTPTIVKMTANGASQTVITVAAGTRFLLYGAVTNHTAAHQLQIYDTDGVTAMLNIYGAANDSATVSASVPMRIYTAGQLVKAVDTNTSLYSIWGITETV